MLKNIGIKKKSERLKKSEIGNPINFEHTSGYSSPDIRLSDRKLEVEVTTRIVTDTISVVNSDQGFQQSKPKVFRRQRKNKDKNERIGKTLTRDDLSGPTNFLHVNGYSKVDANSDETSCSDIHKDNEKSFVHVGEVQVMDVEAIAVTVKEATANVVIVNAITPNIPTANAETANAETANTETANAETVNAERDNASTVIAAETLNAETVNAETANAETANTETANAETVNAEGDNASTVIAAETLNAETINAERDKASTVIAAITNAETANAEIDNVETVKVETGNTEITNAETSNEVTGNTEIPNAETSNEVTGHAERANTIVTANEVTANEITATANRETENVTIAQNTRENFEKLEEFEGNTCFSILLEKTEEKSNAKTKEKNQITNVIIQTPFVSVQTKGKEVSITQNKVKTSATRKKRPPRPPPPPPPFPAQQSVVEVFEGKAEEDQPLKMEEQNNTSSEESPVHLQTPGPKSPPSEKCNETSEIITQTESKREYIDNPNISSRQPSIIIQISPTPKQCNEAVEEITRNNEDKSHIAESIEGIRDNQNQPPLTEISLISGKCKGISDETSINIEKQFERRKATMKTPDHPPPLPSLVSQQPQEHKSVVTGITNLAEIIAVQLKTLHCQ